jgi:hypothetical protein
MIARASWASSIRYNLNAIPYGTTFTRAAQDPTLYTGGVVPAVQPNLPLAYSQAGLSFTGQNALPIDYLRPYPGYADISFRAFDATSNYNSLQVSVNRRTLAQPHLRGRLHLLQGADNGQQYRRCHAPL